MLNGTSLDTSTQALLQTLTAAVHSSNSTGSPESEIETLAANVKQKIDSQLVNLRGTSAEFAEKISEIIENKEWAELPAPAALEMTLTQINEVAAALAQVVDNITTDIGEIFRVLMELNRKIMVDNRKAQVADNLASNNEAKAAIKDREQAAWMQFGAEMAAAVAQFATAAASFKGAAGSLRGAHASVEASREAHTMTVGKGTDDSTSLISLKQKADQTASKTQYLEKQLQKLPANDPQHAQIKQQYESAKSEARDAEFNFKKREGEVEQKQAESMKERLLADAGMQLHKAVGEAYGAVLNVYGATLKFLATSSNLQADQHDLNKSLAEKSYQANQEVISSVRETLRGLLNTLQALEQTLSNLNSLLSRNTA